MADQHDEHDENIRTVYFILSLGDNGWPTHKGSYFISSHSLSLSLSMSRSVLIKFLLSTDLYKYLRIDSQNVAGFFVSI